MVQRIQVRRDTAANWTSDNPVLRLGEIGFVTDSSPRKFKIGDGATAFNSLSTFVEEGATPGGGISGPDLTDINTITSSVGAGLFLNAGDADVDSSGSSAHLSGSSGSDPVDAPGFAGGDGVVSAGAGSDATGADTNGGVGGSVKLNPGAGGAGNGAGDTGADGQVTVNDVPVFDAQGHLLQPDNTILNIESISGPDAVVPGGAASVVFFTGGLGGDNDAGPGGDGASFQLVGGNGGSATDGDNNGGAGGNVELFTGNGGSESGAGTAGANGKVTVNGVPVFDAAGNLLQAVESITSGADPIEANPDVAVTILTTGGTKGQEIVTLADYSGDSPFFKTFQVNASSDNDVPTLIIASPVGVSDTILITINGTSGSTAIVQLVWNPNAPGWQVIVGGAVFTNGNNIVMSGGALSTGGGQIDTGGADIIAGAGNISGAQLSAGNGYNGTFTGTDLATKTVTVVAGIITDISVV